MEASAYFVLILLIIGFTLQFIMYKTRFLLHPSFWFFVIWISSITSFLIYLSAGMDYIVVYEDLVIELLKYISFTVLSLLFVSLLSFRKIRNNHVNWNPVFDIDHFRILTIIILIFTVSNFFLNGGFDLVKNRENASLQAQAISTGGSVSAVQMLFNLVTDLNVPMLIFSGYFICKEYVRNGYKISSLRIYYLFPFLTGLIRTLSVGGRAGMIDTLLYIFLGFVLALFGLKTDISRVLRKLPLYGLMLFLLFSVYSTFVETTRERNQTQVISLIESRWANYPLLKPFAGILQYMTDHIAGYQARRVDSTTPELEMGQISLSGITMFKVPVFSQLAGMPISIQSAFNLKEPNYIKSHYELESSGATWIGATATIYYLLYDDFGYKGTFIAIFILVLISQLIFNRVFNREKTSFLSILPITLIYYIWFTTIFSHTIIGNWLASFLFSFIIVDIIGRIKS
jgi:oligosaccharide repeat unit polymerase